MSIFTHQELKRRSVAMKSDNYRIKTKGAEQVLKEDASVSFDQDFDVFLSHSYFDADEIMALKEAIESFGYRVYVDWIVDKQMSRKDVTAATAETLRKRMRKCNCLLFATSINSPTSKWMPWELGFFDGLKGKVAILPVGDSSTDLYDGQEYLGLYYYITQDPKKGDDKKILWIHETKTKYITFDGWLKNGGLPTEHS